MSSTKTKPAAKKTERTDVYEMITARILEALEAGRIPWRKSWRGGAIYAQNYATKHIYRGINALLTSLSPYDVPYFMTFKQVKKMGGSIKKGAKSLPIVFWNASYRDADGKKLSEEEARGRGDAKKKMFLKYFRVFNIEDIEGIDFELPKMELNAFEPIKKCESLIEHMPSGPSIENTMSDKACYSPVLDSVFMPLPGQFDSEAEYYGTLMHELVHATGHSSRLNREELMSKAKFGSLTYTKEELTAEIGAAFLCNIAGIETPALVENSEAYITGWMRELKNDKKFILSAASKAKKAVAYILGE